jgi:hypothetical protein
MLFKLILLFQSKDERIFRSAKKSSFETRIYGGGGLFLAWPTV